MEKQVILEEIDMYEDRPGFVAFDRARKAHFGPHPLGNSVLGTSASVSALSRDQMLGYFRSRYVSSNILVSAAGNVDWDEFVALATRHCAGWEPGEAARASLTEAGGGGGRHAVRKDGVAQEYWVRISAGPPAESPLRYAADTLAVALGDASGSRFYWALVDPGTADSADMSYAQYEAAGAYFASFSSDPDRARRNREVVEDILRSVQASGILEEELNQARSKNVARWVRMNERPLNRMQLIASGWRYQHQYLDIDSELRSYEGVTLRDIRDVLDRFPVDRGTALAYGPVGGSDGAAGEA